MYSDYPAVEEYLEDYGESNRFKRALTPELRADLHQYREEELFTTDAFYVGKKTAEA
jgi:hypothetical protein